MKTIYSNFHKGLITFYEKKGKFHFYEITYKERSLFKVNILTKCYRDYALPFNLN